MHSYVLLQAAMLIVMLGRRGKVMLVLLDFDGRAVACGKAARSQTRIDPKLGPEGHPRSEDGGAGGPRNSVRPVAFAFVAHPT